MSLSLPFTPRLVTEPATPPSAAAQSAAPLFAALAGMLRDLGIRHCLWKGYDRPERALSGAGDLDLLVDVAHAAPFAGALTALGFKLALPPDGRHVAGIQSWLGYDARGGGRLLHVHVHFRLIAGTTWRRHYDLGCERAVLDTAEPGDVFKVPAAEFQWILFVIKQTLRHRAADALRRRQPAWLAAVQPSIARLGSLVDHGLVRRTLSKQLPDIPHRLFDRCVAVLEPAMPGSRRLAARRDLERALAAGRLVPPPRLAARRAARALARAAGLKPAPRRKRLATGGVTIALSGTDGAGKSTCAAALLTWLGAELDTRHAHLGRPPRALATLAAGVLLKAGTVLHRVVPSLVTKGVVAHLELLRAVARGRDRYRLYRRMRRFALEGGIAVCERYPLAEDRALVGPSASQGVALDARGMLAWVLRRLEWRYYAHIARPDHVYVLAVDPDTAVRRKTDEPEGYVRARAVRLWSTDWSGSGAEVVDAVRPFADVLADVKARVWKVL